MKELADGVRAFQQQVFRGKKSLFHALAQGQSPHTLFITCSDSRIDPNLITQTDPGELFVIRNAGNLIPVFGASKGGEASAIEFAVAGLGVRNIVVCGHSSCGAMKGLMQPDLLSELPVVADWLQHADETRRIVSLNPQDGSSEDILRFATEQNVLVQLENLNSHPAVAARIQTGEIELAGWVYDIQNGMISSYSGESKRFQPL